MEASRMKTPGELTRKQLEDIVGRIQSILWLEPTTDAFDPDRSWDVETIEWVSEVLEDAGLRPGTTSPATGVVPESTGPGAQPEDVGPEGHPSGTSGSTNAVRAALDDFIETIEAVGGCLLNEAGVLAPIGEPEWTDLADAYVRACNAIGRIPQIDRTEDMEEF
jgi:hypothetical protein